MRAVGVADLERYRSGARLTPGQMIKAKCAECMCQYEDGKEDCGIRDCPLYPAMPYRSVEACTGLSSTLELIPKDETSQAEEVLGCVS